MRLARQLMVKNPTTVARHSAFLRKLVGDNLQKPTVACTGGCAQQGTGMQCQQVWPYLASHDAQSHTRSAAADGQEQSRQYAAAGMLGSGRADLVTNDSLV